METWPATHRRRWFLALLVSMLFVFAELALVDAALRTTAAPTGIVSFEFAMDAATAVAIVASWRAAEVLYLAGFSLGFDFVYLVLYSTVLAAGCASLAAKARRTGRLRWAGLGALVAWGQWLAAASDAAENASLLRILEGGDPAFWAPTATTFAILKFALIASGLTFIVAAAVALRTPKAQPDAT